MEYTQKDTEREIKGFDVIVKEIVELKHLKAQDYGNSWRVFGLAGLVFQVGSKFVRIWNLTQRGKQPTNESLYDSFRDAAVYCIMACQMIKEGRTEDAFTAFGAIPDGDINYAQADEGETEPDPVRGLTSKSTEVISGDGLKNKGW